MLSMRSALPRATALALWLVVALVPWRIASAATDLVNFDVPAGPAAQTLPIYTTQAGLQVLFGYDDVRGIETHAVHGLLDVRSALEQMTSGTRLRFDFMDGDTVTLTVAPSGRARAKTPGNPVARNGEKSAVDRRSLLSTMEEITITATPDRPTIAQAASRLITLSRSEIDSLGQPTVQDTLRTIPQVFGGGPSEDTHLGFEALSNSAFGAGVNLRGLGAGSTLVLVNGRRLSGSGNDAIFVDVSSLPLSIVERIEILPDSSSTRYGADAVGGVVNFVLADTMSGTQTNAFFGAGTESSFHENQVSQLFGMNFGSFAGLVAFDYYDRENLPTADRTQAHSDLRRFGGDNFDTVLSNPGTIMLGPSTTWAIPPGQDGTQLTPGDFVLGTQNKEDLNGGADVLPTQRHLTLFASGKMPLNDEMQLFADLFYSHHDTHFIGAGQRTTLMVPASNAFFANPTSTPLPALFVGYDFSDDLGPLVTNTSVATSKLVTGVDFDPSEAWHLTGTLDFAADDLDSRTDNNVDTTQVALALADSNRATALNVFGDGSHTNPATLARIRMNGSLRSESRMWSGALTGMRELPGLGKTGSLMLGADFRRNSFSSELVTGNTLQSAHDLSRMVTAAFASATLPMHERLELSLGERLEHYSDFGTTRSPRLGLTWRMPAGVSLRGTWSKSLRPPNLLDLDESGNFVALQPVRDPSAPGGLAQVLLRGGKNAQLRQERAESWTAGLDLEPASIPSLALAVTYFDTRFRDRRDVPQFAQDILVNPTMTDLIERAPTAAQIAAACDGVRLVGIASCSGLPIAAIADLRVRNSAYVHTNGVDLNAQYTLHMDTSSLMLGLSGTKLFIFETMESPSSPELDLLSTQNNPIDLRLLGSVEWKRRAFTTSAHVSYYDGYRDITSAPERHVRSWTTVDLRLAYDIGTNTQSWLSGTTFALNAENAFDSAPPFLNNPVGMGYDQENGELTGRILSISMRKKW